MNAPVLFSLCNNEFLNEGFALEEAPTIGGKPNWGDSIPTTIALSTALFTAMGFLATRSYIGSLGLPDHVNIPVDGYLQHGGRFFFVLAVHTLNPRPCRRFAARFPHHFGRDGLIGAPVLHRAREQVRLRMPGAPWRRSLRITRRWSGVSGKL